jgi:hypothetical protein
MKGCVTLFISQTFSPACAGFGSHFNDGVQPAASIAERRIGHDDDLVVRANWLRTREPRSRMTGRSDEIGTGEPLAARNAVKSTKWRRRRNRATEVIVAVGLRGVGALAHVATVPHSVRQMTYLRIAT